jgi:hypothetical protein
MDKETFYHITMLNNEYQHEIRLQGVRETFLIRSFNNKINKLAEILSIDKDLLTTEDNEIWKDYKEAAEKMNKMYKELVDKTDKIYISHDSETEVTTLASKKLSTSPF